MVKNLACWLHFFLCFPVPKVIQCSVIMIFWIFLINIFITIIITISARDWAEGLRHAELELYFWDAPQYIFFTPLHCSLYLNVSQILFSSVDSVFLSCALWPVTADLKWRWYSVERPWAVPQINWFLIKSGYIKGSQDRVSFLLKNHFLYVFEIHNGLWKLTTLF